MQRIIAVYNPRSSRFTKVCQEVLDYLPSLRGYTIGKYEISPTNFEQNVSNLSRLLQNNDLVISAGGDATTAIAANACLKSHKNISLAALPYGNFSDFAHALNLREIEQIFCSDVKTIDFYPLEIHVNDKFFRYATCYVTIGMTAESVGLFDEPSIRRKLHSTRRTHLCSYIHLAKWYFKNHHTKIFLPGFQLNSASLASSTTDYFAINSKFACHIMKGNTDFQSPQTFHSLTSNLAAFHHLCSFMTKSIFAHIPANPTKGDILEFAHPATITIQAEGEYRTFPKVTKIEIKKSQTSLKVKYLK